MWVKTGLVVSAASLSAYLPVNQLQQSVPVGSQNLRQHDPNHRVSGPARARIQHLQTDKNSR